MKDEGIVLNHCVLDYSRTLSRGETNIYFLRKNDSIEIPFYTAEVLYNESTKKYELVQCFGENNTTYKEKEFEMFVYKWIRTNKILIRCEI